jgi:pimeloyl-ACP methyl ester carboxylesterase
MYMDRHQRLIRVNKVDINVVEAGAGDLALVFLHYWGGSSRTWDPTIERLSQAHRCVAIDFRGWGLSDKSASDYKLDTLADDVIGVIADLGLKSFVLVGHSMGGKVAQLLAARRPEGLKRLVLVAPAPPTALDVPEEQRRGIITVYQAREGVEVAIGRLTVLPLSKTHREQVIEDSLSGAPDAKRAWPEEGMIRDISNEASKILVPVHVIVGGADNVETESSLRAAFGGVLPATEFTVLPGVGHLAPLEAPAELAGAIKAVLTA